VRAALVAVLLLLPALPPARHVAVTGCPRAEGLWAGVNAGVTTTACPTVARGFVGVYFDRPGVGITEEQVWWTIDSGTHWFRTRRVGLKMFSAGSRVYWLYRGAIMRVSRWPTLAKARSACRFYVRGSCHRPRFVDAGTRSTVLLRLDDAAYDVDAVLQLPDGFVAPVQNTRKGLPPLAVVVRGPVIRVAHLPDYGRWEVCGGSTGPRRATGPMYISACVNGLLVASWVSRDGGKTWSRG
jgi:hypothetical protein